MKHNLGWYLTLVLALFCLIIPPEHQRRSRPGTPEIDSGQILTTSSFDAQPRLTTPDPTQITVHPTPTPFQPSISQNILLPVVYASTNTASVKQKPFSPVPPASPAPLVPAFAGIDFARQDSRIRIRISPPDGLVHRGKTITMAFFPAQICNFGDQQACVYTVRSQFSKNVLFLTVHSGVGGQAESLRHALEGTGINRAGFKLSRVQENLHALIGAPVTIEQARVSSNNLVLKGITRIPADSLQQYFSLPLERTLLYASKLDPSFLTGLDPARPVLVFETCGWKMSAEPWAPGVTETSGSVYLGIIQEVS